jgi:hypothetical protein
MTPALLTAPEMALIQRLRAGWIVPKAVDTETPVNQFMASLRATLGDEAMDRDAGKWRNRFNVRREDSLRALAELERRLHGGQPIRCPAKYLEHIWTSKS